MDEIRMGAVRGEVARSPMSQNGLLLSNLAPSAAYPCASERKLQ
jgi:hypothetical protein